MIDWSVVASRALFHVLLWSSCSNPQATAFMHICSHHAASVIDLCDALVLMAALFPLTWFLSLHMSSGCLIHTSACMLAAVFLRHGVTFRWCAEASLGFCGPVCTDPVLSACGDSGSVTHAHDVAVARQPAGVGGSGRSATRSAAAYPR